MSMAIECNTFPVLPHDCRCAQCGEGCIVHLYKPIGHAYDCGLCTLFMQMAPAIPEEEIRGEVLYQKHVEDNRGSWAQAENLVEIWDRPLNPLVADTNANHVDIIHDLAINSSPGLPAIEHKYSESKESVLLRTKVTLYLEKENGMLKCKLCPKTMKTSSHGADHIYTKHKECLKLTEPRFTCTCNGFETNWESSAKKHQRTAGKSFTCESCEKTLSRADYALGAHRKSCRGLRKKL